MYFQRGVSYQDVARNVSGRSSELNGCLKQCPQNCCPCIRRTSVCKPTKDFAQMFCPVNATITDKKVFSCGDHDIYMKTSVKKDDCSPVQEFLWKLHPVLIPCFENPPQSPCEGRLLNCCCPQKPQITHFKLNPKIFEPVKCIEPTCPPPKPVKCCNMTLTRPMANTGDHAGNEVCCCKEDNRSVLECMPEWARNLLTTRLPCDLTPCNKPPQVCQVLPKPEQPCDYIFGMVNKQVSGCKTDPCRNVCKETNATEISNIAVINKPRNPCNNNKPGLEMTEIIHHSSSEVVIDVDNDVKEECCFEPPPPCRVNKIIQLPGKTFRSQSTNVSHIYVSNKNTSTDDACSQNIPNVVIYSSDKLRNPCNNRRSSRLETAEIIHHSSSKIVINSENDVEDECCYEPPPCCPKVSAPRITCQNESTSVSHIYMINRNTNTDEECPEKPSNIVILTKKPKDPCQDNDFSRMEKTAEIIHHSGSKIVINLDLGGKEECCDPKPQQSQSTSVSIIKMKNKDTITDKECSPWDSKTYYLDSAPSCRSSNEEPLLVEKKVTTISRHHRRQTNCKEEPKTDSESRDSVQCEPLLLENKITKTSRHRRKKTKLDEEQDIDSDVTMVSIEEEPVFVKHKMKRTSRRRSSKTRVQRQSAAQVFTFQGAYTNLPKGEVEKPVGENRSSETSGTLSTEQTVYNLVKVKKCYYKVKKLNVPNNKSHICYSENEK